MITSGTSFRSGSSGDSAIVDLQWRSGYRYSYQTPMTCFWAYWDGSGFGLIPDMGVYDGTLQMYNLLRGAIANPMYPQFVPMWEAFPPPYDHPSNYVFSGDPVTRTGFIDGVSTFAGARSIFLFHGPINMSLNDSAEIVVATIGAEGINYISGVSLLQLFSRYARSAFIWSANLRLSPR